MRGGIRVSIRVVMVQKFGARCYSVCYSELLQYLMRPSMRPYGCPHEIPDLVFSSSLRATVIATVPPGLENAIFGAEFVLHCVVELPGLL